MLNEPMTRIRQKYDKNHIRDVRTETIRAIKESGVPVKPGAKVAVAVGSRGIANIADIVAATVESVRAMGAEAFIVPAMGSHGGATAHGQQEVLAGYGVTEDKIGAKILSSMKVVELDNTGLEHRVFMDAHAAQADGIIAINRIKVHTDFHGPTESGLMKLLTIGLGKHAMALELHSFGIHGLRDLLPGAARRVIESGKILLGIGVCENAYDQTALICAAPAHKIEETEIELLKWSRAHMPSLPSKDIDVLIVDRMGKDISGSGMDTNIIGRMRIDGEPEPESPRIKAIIVDDLTEQSHGNALGIGLADYITENLKRKINFDTTYENVITSTFLKRGFMPVTAPTAQQAYRYALRTCGLNDKPVKAMRIRDTLHIDEIYVSGAILCELAGRDDIEIVGNGYTMFGEGGALKPFDK